MGLRYELDDYIENHLRSKTIKSNIAQVSNGQPCVLGLNDSGKNCVLGPVVVIVTIYPLASWTSEPPSKVRNMTNMTRSQRMALLNEYRTNWRKLAFVARIISPNFVSNYLGRNVVQTDNRYYDITDYAMANAIKCVADCGVNISHVQLASSHKSVYDRLKLLMPKFDIKLEEKDHDSASMAKIAHLYSRAILDRILRKWKFVESRELGLYKYDIGTGQGSDTKSRKFLDETFDEVFGFSTLVKFNFRTIEKSFEEGGAICHWPPRRSSTHSLLENNPSFFKPRKLTRAQFW